MSAPLYPISPRLRFRVGVSGHRIPPKLPTESVAPIRAVLDRLLAIIVEAVRGAEAAYMDLSATVRGQTPGGSSAADLASQFTVVSSVAEGSDRLVAEAGLAAGFTLEVVLPFDRTEYARDFASPQSKQKYEELLSRASAVFELDGAAGDRSRAYEAAGIVMLANADLLVAIWDGKEANGIGGTAEIVSRAISDGIPVVWIDPSNPNAMKLAWPVAGEIPTATVRAEESFRTTDDAELARTITEFVAPPRRPHALNAMKIYLGENERHWNYCPWYPLLLALYRVRKISWGDFHLAGARAYAEHNWSRFLQVLPADRTQRPAVENILQPAFAAADHIAVYYSLVYRSGYVFNFIFAAVAVALALGGVFTHNPEIKSTMVGIELAVIVAILGNWIYGHRQQLHRRWLEYRRLAESLRHQRIFVPLGAQGSVDRPRRRLDGEDEDWVDWYAWSVRRQLPLPDRRVDREYLAALRDALCESEIAGQITYHQQNAERMHKLDHRIHRTGLLLFAATACLCVAFVGAAASGLLSEEHPGRDLFLEITTYLGALLPTLGAALGAIHVQGDFRTVAEQSKRTGRHLSAIAALLAKEEPTFARLADRIEKTSEVMIANLLEWQTVFRTRPLSLPA